MGNSLRPWTELGASSGEVPSFDKLDWTSKMGLQTAWPYNGPLFGSHLSSFCGMSGWVFSDATVTKTAQFELKIGGRVALADGDGAAAAVHGLNPRGRGRHWARVLVIQGRSWLL